MKKFFLGLFIFLIAPFMVEAIDYDITDFAVKAYIKPNGDVEVNEIIVLNGTFNGYERDLDFRPSLNDKYESSTIYQGSGIEDISIKGKYVSSFSDALFEDNSFINFAQVSSASNGEMAKYIRSNLSSGLRLRMYYKASNQKVAFYLKYTIKDLVVKHEDVAEIYFPFIGDAFEDDIKSVDIKVYLPSSDTSDYMRVWAHGALSGEVEKIDNNYLHAYAKNIDAGEVIDVRMSFDTNLVPLAKKKTNQNYLDKILAVEEKRADDANKLREELLLKYNVIKYGTIIFYIGVVLLGLFVYQRYGKSPKSGYYSKYNREFIDDYNVEIVDYLMNKKITPNAMSASIMNLIYKKNISVKDMLNNKKTKEYEFTLENMDNVNESEKLLIEFLFDRVGKNKDTTDKKTFTTLELKNYAKGYKTCDKFISSYTKWKNNVMNVATKENFYEKSGVPIILGIVVLIIGGILFAMGMNFGVDFLLIYFIPVVCVVFMFYTILLDKKTVKGAEHYDKWKAFKNFLNDFGSFELKELPEIVLWERYLVYATVFGLADKVQKSMNVHIKELEMSDIDYYPSFIYIDLGHSINSSINNAINSAYSSQAANYANSHSSSSSGGGFGGGFSGGSGFSGGGGGRGF